MISVRRPSTEDLVRYREERLETEPTCLPADQPPRGFHREVYRAVVGEGPDAFARARLGIDQWAAQIGSGFEIVPVDAPIVEGAVVAFSTQQMGLWIVAACRIETVVDEPNRYGFVYATLPDHPECGYESFMVSEADGVVTYELEPVSKPGVPIVWLGAPVTRLLQRNAAHGYVAAMTRFVAG